MVTNTSDETRGLFRHGVHVVERRLRPGVFNEHCYRQGGSNQLDDDLGVEVSHGVCWRKIKPKLKYRKRQQNKTKQNKTKQNKHKQQTNTQTNSEISLLLKLFS